MPLVGRCVWLRDDAVLLERPLLCRQLDERCARLSLHLCKQWRRCPERVGVLCGPGAQLVRPLCAAVRGNRRLVRRFRELLQRADVQRVGDVRRAAHVQVGRHHLQREVGVLLERARLRL